MQWDKSPVAPIQISKEPLINSESFSCVGKMPERRTVQIKAPIAGNSKAIAKIGKAYRILLSPLACVPAGDAELVHFN
jgi:hypothetical protein